MRQILAKVTLSAAILSGAAIAAHAAPQGGATHDAGTQPTQAGSGVVLVADGKSPPPRTHRTKGTYEGATTSRPEPVPPAPETPD